MGTKPYGGHQYAADLAADTADAAVKSAVPLVSPSIAQSAPIYDPAAFLAAALLRLVDNKLLPKFQFERAVGPFLGVFLPEILRLWKNWDVQYVVSEFPIKKRNNNQSTNLDELFYRQPSATAKGGWVFFELKTDARSVNASQLATYLAAMKRGMVSLLGDVPTIAQASTQKLNYKALMDRVSLYPTDGDIELVYLAPKKVILPPGFAGCSHVYTFSDLETLQLTRFAPEWERFRNIVLPVFA